MATSNGLSWLLFTTCLALASVQAGQTTTPFESAVNAEDIDTNLSRQRIGETDSVVQSPALLGALGFKPGQIWSAGKGERDTKSTFQYVLVFKNPVAIGSFYLSPAEGWGFVSRQVQMLKPDAAPDSKNDQDWEAVPASIPSAGLHVLPPAAKTRAFRVIETRNEGTSEIRGWFFFKRRLHSLTVEAAGIGERGSFCWNPSNVIQGQHWVNAALDPDPTAKATKILRPPVSDIAPSWFILNWDQARAISGVFLRSNATKLKLYSYIGNPNLNPALATNDDWARIDFTAQRELTHNQDKEVPHSRWLAFDSVKTQAIKVFVTETAPKNDPCFHIKSFAALTDLLAAPIPAAPDNAPAYRFKYNLKQDGDTALAIRTPDGKHIRTLYSQLEKTVGEQVGEWDLKDDAGRSVPAGSYVWEALNAPPLELHYEMTLTPNVEARSADRTPWHQEISGPHGWLADHAMGTTCTTLGDKVYFGAPGVEGGTAFIECDLNGVKQWGKVNFGAWTGVNHLTQDGQAVLIHAGATIYRMEPATHEIKPLCNAKDPARKGYLQSIAGHSGKLYLARSSPAPFVDNAAADWQVDLDSSLPLLPKSIPGTFRTQPNPRADFLRVLRLTGTPPGQHNNQPNVWPVYLDSSKGKGRRQHVVVAFKEPIAIGSLIFPHPGGKPEVSFSTLKPGAPYPPNAARAADWVPFENNGKQGWECVAAPKNTLTRALRVTFTQPGDEVDDLLAGPDANPGLGATSALDAGDIFAKPAAGDVAAAETTGGWSGKLEGLKILRRRLSNLFPTAKVRVNSGVIGTDGVWDAKRTASLTPENPGIYLMEWDAPQSVCAMSFKEVDGAKTEIDVWTGAETGPIDLNAKEGWKKVGTYTQNRRDYYEPDFKQNTFARYMDGYVNFEEEIKTRAIRLRVVEQWLESGHYPLGLRADQGGRELNPARCRIFGVAPLGYIGGEVPLDTGVYKGLDIFDSQSGKLAETIRVDPGYCLATNAAGELFTLRDLGIQKLDTKTGAATPIVKDLKNPERLAIGPDGSFYVYCGKGSGYVVRAFDKDGKHLRDIGHPGSIQPGPWDPQRLSNVNAICVDKNGTLWVQDTNDQPRRTVQFKTDGTFVQELLGNTHYGGGGTLNRYDISRAYLGRVEFEIDWAKRSSKIRGVLADQIFGDDLTAVRIKDRMYLTTTPLSYRAEQPFGAVYLYDDKTGTTRLCAAFGEAMHFPPMFDSAAVAAMKGKTPKEFRFLWTDTDGDGKVSVAETQLEEKSEKDGNVKLGRFDSELGCLTGNTLYSVKEFRPDGTPVYEKKTLAASGLYRLKNGNVISMDAPSQIAKGMENAVFSAKGERLWGHPTDHPSVSGLWVPPWAPGYVTNQFAIIGHETAKTGDLGEYVVIHHNNGQWTIWSADGFLAGHVMLHLGDRKSKRFNATSSARGTRLDPLSAGQEHFHGFLTQNETDGRVHIIAGHNHVSLIEVKGFEKFKRTRGDIAVNADDIRRVREWESRKTRRDILSAISVIECLRPQSQPKIDGIRGENEWPAGPVLDEVSFSMTYDASNLYLCYSGAALAPFKNSGVDFQRYFKTGAIVDFHIGADPKADLGRTRPVAGDSRIVMTVANGKPQVVLYQPISPNAKPNEAWETFTEAAGKNTFERVVILSSAKLAVETDKQGSVIVEAAIPLKEIGLNIEPGLRLKMDWGVQFSDDGNQVKRRTYWANKMANGTSDESFESRLEPHLWGYVLFPKAGSSNSKVPSLDKEEPKGGDILDILER